MSRLFASGGQRIGASASGLKTLNTVFDLYCRPDPDLSYNPDPSPSCNIVT